MREYFFGGSFKHGKMGKRKGFGEPRVCTILCFYRQIFYNDLKYHLSGSSPAEVNAVSTRLWRTKGFLEKYPPYFTISTRKCMSKTNCSATRFGRYSADNDAYIENIMKLST